MKINLENIECVIEIPKNSNIKYEIDTVSKQIKVDRILYGSQSYPQNYGFFENTLDYDGDPLDVLVISDQPFIPGCIVPVRIIGGLEMIDNNEEDTKLIGVINCDPRYSEYKNILDLDNHRKLEIKNFFETYKILQNKKVEIGNFFDVEKAKEVLAECHGLFEEFSRSKKDKKQFLTEKHKLKTAK